MKIDHFTQMGLQPRREWVHAGLDVATYANRFYGNINGYVRLPLSHPDLMAAEWAQLTADRQPFLMPDGRLMVSQILGYDHIDVPVHGGWTYGPDIEGWIGFDTHHDGDRWPQSMCREFVQPQWREHLEFALALDERYPTPTLILWSEERLEAEVERVAHDLFVRACKAAVFSGLPFDVPHPDPTTSRTRQHEAGEAP